MKLFNANNMYIVNTCQLNFAYEPSKKDAIFYASQCRYMLDTVV